MSKKQEGGGLDDRETGPVSLLNQKKAALKNRLNTPDG